MIKLNLILKNRDQIFLNFYLRKSKNEMKEGSKTKKFLDVHTDFNEGLSVLEVK